MTYTIGELEDSTWDAFADLVERNNGIYVDPKHRGDGIARTALELFERYGLVKVRRVGEHVWIMSRTLDRSANDNLG